MFLIFYLLAVPTLITGNNFDCDPRELKWPKMDFYSKVAYAWGFPIISSPRKWTFFDFFVDIN